VNNRVVVREGSRAEVAAFVRELYARSGCATWDQFAKRAAVLPVQLSDWQRGRSAPSGYNLLKLIRAAGVLQEPAETEVLARVDGFISTLENSPSQVERFESELREMSDDVAALAKAADQTAERLASLLHARNHD
jgi:hypothetical protein